MSGVTLDAGALIAIERHDRRMLLILDSALTDGAELAIPSTALAQVVRNPARQARLWHVLRSKRAEIVPLDFQQAVEVGRLLAASTTSDVVDAHVVACARRRGHAVITSDVFALRRLDAKLRVIPV